MPGRRIKKTQTRLPTGLPGKRVIGIDLATTRCCIAYSAAIWGELDRLHDNDARPPTVEVFSSWTAAKGGSRTNPITALYYESPNRLPITGNDLDPILNAKRRIGKTNFDTERFFRLWKLMFHGDQNDPSTKAIQADIQRKLDRLEITMDDLLRGWVAVAYASLFEEDANGRVKLRIRDERIMELEVVIAVPPGRSVIAHEQVLQAFVQGPIRAHQVSLVSEPEAMFRSWVADGIDTQHWKVGQTYLVCDGGGGTCCFVRFRLDRLDPLGFTQEFESESIICGAETISNVFEELAATMVPVDISNRPWVLDNLRRQFDDAFKLTFGGIGYDEREYCFQKPWDHSSEILFSCEQIAACFDVCIRKLVRGIQHQLQRDRPRQTSSSSSARSFASVDCLVLGGGLFENPYVMKKIRDEFPSLNTCELANDFNSKKHVAQGAVLTRLYARNGFISSRPIMRSKAVLTWMQVDDSIRGSPIYDLLDTYKDERNKVEYFYAAQWLVKQGDEAVSTHADDFYEIASEASVETARTRAFSLKTRNLEFSETILTVNYHPGKATWAAVCKDNKLIDPNGNLNSKVPDYEESEKITWDPQKFGLPLDSLEVMRPWKQPPYRTLRYSIQMQLREVGTNYWIKAYYLDNKKEKKYASVRSEATERQALFHAQEISQNLSQSRKLGSGIRFEGDPADDVDVSTELQQPHQTTSNSEQSRPADSISTCGMSKESVPSPDPIAGEPAPRFVQYPSKLDSGIYPSTLATPGFPPNPKKRTASGESPRQRLHKFSKNPLNIRPTQRQSIESSGEYSLGTRRNNGGCWTCAFRNLKCQQGKPSCPQCSKVGVVCEYGRPIWWYDEALKEEQREINKRLIKDKARISSQERQSATKSPAPRERPAVSPLTTVNKNPNQVSLTQVDAQQSKSFQPPMAVHPGTRRGTTLLDKLWDETTVLQKRSESIDMYGASPPPKPQNRQPAGKESLGSYVRRSTRPRVHFFASDMKVWNEVDEEEIGLLSESDSRAEESSEEYVAGAD